MLLANSALLCFNVQSPKLLNKTRKIIRIKSRFKLTVLNDLKNQPFSRKKNVDPRLKT